MDEVLFVDGTTKLKVSVAGVNRDGQVSSDDFRLTIFAYDEGPPIKPLYTAELGTEQAAILHRYLDSISVVRDVKRSISGRFIELCEEVSEAVIRSLLDQPEYLQNTELVRAVLKINPDLCRAILETEINAVDVQSLAYRRSQLEIMRNLIHDPEFFEEYRLAVGKAGKEATWQDFFEKNQWIFGFALHYVIGDGVCPDRLEQVVAGHSIAGAGKRTDALLRTRGILKSLCYIEIKTHDTPLLHHAQYRPEVWRVSDELSGAVAQSQKTVQLAVEHLRTKLELPESGTYYNLLPRSVVVCGSLAEFSTKDGTDSPKFSSFELFRRSIHTPDILTFDELHERATAIVEAGFVSRQAAPPAE